MVADIDRPSKWDRLAHTETIATSARRRDKKKVTLLRVPHNPPQTTTNSFFDRLSKTETFATATSKGKTAPAIKKSRNTREITPKTVGKTTNAFFDRMSKAETYATSTMKGKISPINGDTPTTPESLADKKLTTNAFFERMSKAETYATSDMKGKISPTHEATISPINGDTSPTPESLADKKLTTNAFFERMSKAETYATSDMKGKISPTHEATNEVPTCPDALTTNAFFDRMSKAETYATSSMKGKISPDDKPRKRQLSSPR